MNAIVRVRGCLLPEPAPMKLIAIGLCGGRFAQWGCPERLSRAKRGEARENDGRKG
jgi:hypothetical protein